MSFFFYWNCNGAIYLWFLKFTSCVFCFCVLERSWAYILNKTKGLSDYGFYWCNRVLYSWIDFSSWSKFVDLPLLRANERGKVYYIWLVKYVKRYASVVVSLFVIHSLKRRSWIRREMWVWMSKCDCISSKPLVQGRNICYILFF